MFWVVQCCFKCFNQKNTLYPLSWNNGDGVKIAIKIKKIVDSFNLDEEKTFVCHKCLKKLEEFYSFHQELTKSYEIYSGYIAKFNSLDNNTNKALTDEESSSQSDELDESSTEDTETYRFEDDLEIEEEKFDCEEDVKIAVEEESIYDVFLNETINEDPMQEDINEDTFDFPCLYCSANFTTENELNKHTSKHLKKSKSSKVSRSSSKQQKFKDVKIYPSLEPVKVNNHSCICENVCVNSNKSNDNENEIKSCQKCNLIFFTDDELKNHECSYKYSCVVCNKKFISKKGLKKHKHVCHKVFNCKQCQQKYPNKSAFKNHLKTCYIYFCCKKCDFMTKSEATLSKHEKKHSYKCKQCLEEFKLKRQYTLHLTFHSQKRFTQCEICGQKFLMRDNYLEHYQVHKINT